MKIAGVNYTYGSMAIELIAESEIEHMLLKHIFEKGEMSRGDGRTIAPCGGSTGFYLQCEKQATTNGKDGE